MRIQSLRSILLVVAALMTISTVQAQTTQSSDLRNPRTTEFNFLWSQAKPSRSAFRLMPAGAFLNLSHSRFNFSLTPATNSVMGSGSAGRIAKWIGVMGSNTFVLGNSSIYEDKFGKVGIGTTTPTSPLTVAGLIESTSGGFKFPDGTVQTTSATGALFSVANDATLTGNGTSGSPLGVAVPLNLIGNGLGNSIIVVANNAEGGIGAQVLGGPGSIGPGGRGVMARGGTSISGSGGVGVIAIAGDSNSNEGGVGVFASAGESVSGKGGQGVKALGGSSSSGNGGEGVKAIGGSSITIAGGDGVIAIGGVSANSVGGDGIFARGGTGPVGDGLAGNFDGDVDISGMLSKGGGSFKIDHPLDPENRYLYHSFVESPDMKNIYDGNIVTDANGEATVELPSYFEALNRDFRYQLTVIGTFAQAIVAKKIEDNRFVIRTSAPGVEVSWQVTGIRQDGWANRNRIKVEVEKSERERGHYLHPEAFDQPEELGVEWARHPEIMKQRKEARERARQKQR